jgi:hypothetical protein
MVCAQQSFVLKETIEIILTAATKIIARKRNTAEKYFCNKLSLIAGLNCTQ